MVVYKVFLKNYELRKGEFLGLLVERRKISRGSTELESGLRWARAIFGHEVKEKKAIFIVPDEVILRSDTAGMLMEKGVFNRLEVIGMVKPAALRAVSKKELR